MGDLSDAFSFLKIFCKKIFFLNFFLKIFFFQEKIFFFDFFQKNAQKPEKMASYKEYSQNSWQIFSAFF